MRLDQKEILSTLASIFQDKGLSEADAFTSAELLVQNSLDGIYSHGVNRFPRIISYLDKGYIKPGNKPTLVASLGALEKWDGQLGMGNTNAKLMMDRTIALAKQYGVGCVALRNTNHWMRGGAYGLQAADNGCIGICWTNTQPNMPAWGAKDRRIGNNPLIMVVPKKNSHIMVDGAMAQFSYGAIEAARMAGKQLPVPGGYDSDGNLTKDPGEIEKTWRVLPIGFWKGSGFSIAMDLIAACLSDGNTTYRVGCLSDDEYALSQVFIAFDIEKTSPDHDVLIAEMLDNLKASERIDENVPILYPGEKEYMTRLDNLANGIPVIDEVWNTILSMKK
jgi:3-dehydro-L-gulonate 2-dehydrogenase